MAQKTKETTPKTQSSGMVFGKINYQFMLASILVVALGFFLMSGTTDIYSFTKITLAPIVVIAGFALGFVSILVRPKRD